MNRVSSFIMLGFAPGSKYSQIGVVGSLLCKSNVFYDQVRWHTKHYNPKFKSLRRLKVKEVFPLIQLKGKDMTDEDVEQLGFQNLKYKPRFWHERNLYISTANVVIDGDKFVIPENSTSRNIKEIGKNGLTSVTDTGKDKLALRKIKSYDEDFVTKQFPETALEIYKNAHDCLTNYDEDEITNYFTEYARQKAVHNLQRRTVRWKFLNLLEKPKIMMVRVHQIDGEDDVFAQITLRLFSQQTLAIYDRFGRLIYGSEILAKDVLEYVVFEKHLSNEYGKWRLHDKIIPDGFVSPAEHTYALPALEDVDEDQSTAVPDVAQEEPINMKEVDVRT